MTTVDERQDTTRADGSAADRVLDPHARVKSYITPDPTRVIPVDDPADWPADLAEPDRSYLRDRGVAPLVAAERGYSTASSFAELATLTPGAIWSQGRDKPYGGLRGSQPGVLRVGGMQEHLSAAVSSDGSPATALVIPLYSGLDLTTPATWQTRPTPARETLTEQCLGKYLDSPNLAEWRAMKFELPTKGTTSDGAEIKLQRGPHQGQLPIDINPMVEDLGEAPLLVSEGTAKTDAALTAACREGLDIVPATATGVTMAYYSAKSEHNDTRRPRLTAAILEGLKLTAGRYVYLCWDADWRTNPGVRNPLITTARLLDQLGLVVMVIDVPPIPRENGDPDPKTGLDDYLALAHEEGTAFPLAELLGSAIPWEQAEEETRPYDATDVGRGQRLAAHALRLGTMRYCRTRKQWMKWESTWLDDEGDHAIKAAAKTLATNYLGAEDDKTGRSGAGITNAISLAQSEHGISFSERELDADPWLLAVRNGLVDLRTGDLLPADPSVLTSKLAPVYYNPALLDLPQYGSPVWDAQLTMMFGEGSEDEVTYLQHYLGQGVIGQVFIERLLMIHGAGRNGKSTTFNAIGETVGDYASVLGPSMLMGDGASQFDTAELRGLRLALFNESNKGDRLDGATLKRVASREKQRGERKYQNPFVFFPTNTNVLITNHLPRLTSTEVGLRRRLDVMHARATIGRNGVKENLFHDDVLAAERPSILAWLVDGARKFAEAGALPKCEVVEKETAKYIDGFDTFARFMEDVFAADAGSESRLLRSAIHDLYEKWAAQNRKPSLGNRDLLEKLAKEGHIPSLESEESLPSDKRRIVKSDGHYYVRGLKVTPPYKHIVARQSY